MAAHGRRDKHRKRDKASELRFVKLKVVKVACVGEGARERLVENDVASISTSMHPHKLVARRTERPPHMDRQGRTQSIMNNNYSQKGCLFSGWSEAVRLRSTRIAVVASGPIGA
jgi:hypothetical protein